jgi:hypothetical protein
MLARVARGRSAATTVPFTTDASGRMRTPTDNSTAATTCAVRRLARWPTCPIWLCKQGVVGSSPIISTTAGQHPNWCRQPPLTDQYPVPTGSTALDHTLTRAVSSAAPGDTRHVPPSGWIPHRRGGPTLDASVPNPGRRRRDRREQPSGGPASAPSLRRSEPRPRFGRPACHGDRPAVSMLACGR